MTLLIIVLILALLWVLAVQGRSSHPGGFTATALPKTP